MSCGIELIYFVRPDESRKNLFIANVPGTLTEEELTARFYEIFDKYGLLYRVQLFPSLFKFPQRNEQKTGDQPAPSEGFYAFVTFYSSLAAIRAKEDLNHSITLDNTTCKISFAKRKQDVVEKKILHFTRCYDLVSFYLGFNSWSTSIKTLYEEKNDDVGDTGLVSFVCVTNVKVKDLDTDGIGVSKESFLKSDPMGRIKATAIGKKVCQQRSVENAFAKFILIVLGNGKATIEVDTTLPDPLMQEYIDNEQLIKVNDLDEQPSSEEQLELQNTDVGQASVEDIDELNLHILQELEDDM